MIKIIPSGPFQVNSLIVELGEGRVLVIDPAACAFSGDETKITSYLAQKNLKPLAVLFTHGHFDHVCGLPFFKKCYPDVPVLIHKNDCGMLGSGSENIHSRQLSYMGFEEFIPSVSNLPAADGVLEDGKTVLDCMAPQGGGAQALSGVAQPGTSFQALSEAAPQDGFSLALKEALAAWQIILTPGHTSGSVCFYNKKEKVLISGDTLFYGSWGRTDLGGSEAEIMKSLRFLRENIDPDTVVFPGHDYCGFKMGDNL